MNFSDRQKWFTKKKKFDEFSVVIVIYIKIFSSNPTVQRRNGRKRTTASFRLRRIGSLTWTTDIQCIHYNVQTKHNKTVKYLFTPLKRPSRAGPSL